MQRVLILGAGEMQLPIIQKAISQSIFTIVVDMDDDAPGANIADKFYQISTIDFDKIKQVAIEEHIDGILTTSDFPVNIVARVAQDLSLPAMSVNVAKICTNKYLQRTFLRERDIKTPIFKLVENVSQLVEINYFPVVVKPVDSSASRGVKKVNNSADLLDQYLKSKEFSRQGNVIVEEFLVGREFSVETMTQNKVTTVVAVTEKMINKSEKGYFVEDCHIVPARVSKEEFNKISEEVLHAIEVLGVDNCPTHTEVLLTDRGAYIVEIACRLGGDFITSDLVPLSTGVDMLENLLNLSLGKQVEVEAKHKKVAAVQFLNQENYYKCISLIESGNNSIVRSEIKKYHSNEITSSFDRMGFVILKTDSMEELDQLLSKLKN